LRKLLYGLGGAVALGGLLVLAVLFGIPLPFGLLIQPAATSCKHNDEIVGGERAAVDDAALRFVKALTSADPAAAWPTMSAEAQRTVSAEQLTTFSQQITQSTGSLNDLRVVDTYLVSVLGPATQVICGDLSRPEERVIVASAAVPKQGHVIIRAAGRNNDWVFVIWLTSDGDWRVHYFHFTAMSIVGKSAQDFRALARAEQDVGHRFNATLLYMTAAQLAYRGPNLQWGILPEIQKEMAALDRPQLLQGQVPFTWKLGSESFRILRLGPIGVGGKIYLIITQELSPWPQDSGADLKNRQLISEIKHAIPEYAAVFAGLVIAAQEKDGNHGFRTVDDAPLPQPN